MSFSFSYPYWFLLLCLALGGVFTFLMYWKKKNHFPSTTLFATVCGARFLSSSLLAFLLLSPVLRFLQNKEEKPTIIFVQDHSASQKFAFRKIDSVQYRKQVEQLVKELSETYTVKTYRLGQDLSDTMQFKYTDPASDLSGGLETLMSGLENENVGAIILSSDGIYNRGISPLNINYPFKGSIYSIGLGDTTIQRDALVARVFANKVVYLGDPFAIKTDIAAFGCANETVSVSVYHHNSSRMISSQQVTITDGHFSKSMETIIDARMAGVQHYTISVTKVSGEQNTVNNSQDIYVEVMDSKEAVLIVCNAPHPDVFALKEALSLNKNYKVDVKTAQKMDANISDYNLVVLHNIPSVTYNGSSIIDQAKRLGISTWYILGGQTALPIFNQNQTALQVNSRGLSYADAQAVPNKDFSYFTVNTTPQITALPPLATPFADFKEGVNAQVLMWQKIGSVTTNYPLWILQQTAQQKVGVTAGEGIWRWRLFNYEKYKNYQLVDDYILKTAQYLSVKRDKKQFRVSMPKSVYSESEPIVFDAELYNENYELINSPDVNLTWVNEKNEKQNILLNKEGNAYSSNIGNLAPGNYSYSASTGFNGKSYTANGNFTVVEQNIEEINTTADFGMLNQLSKKYNGEFVFAKDLRTLKDKIKNNPQIKTLIRSHVNTEPLIHWKWLFALLLGLLALEWFIRKRSGNY